MDLAIYLFESSIIFNINLFYKYCGTSLENHASRQKSELHLILSTFVTFQLNSDVTENNPPPDPNSRERLQLT